MYYTVVLYSILQKQEIWFAVNFPFNFTFLKLKQVFFFFFNVYFQKIVVPFITLTLATVKLLH